MWCDILFDPVNFFLLQTPQGLAYNKLPSINRAPLYASSAYSPGPPPLPIDPNRGAVIWPLDTEPLPAHSEISLGGGSMRDQSIGLSGGSIRDQSIGKKLSDTEIGAAEEGLWDSAIQESDSMVRF